MSAVGRTEPWRLALCLLPLLAVACGLGVAAQREREQAPRDETLLTARYLAAAVDRELVAIENSLQVLAGGRALAEGDLEALHRQAQDLVRAQIVNNYVLVDRQGRQLMNTLRPFGSELPQSGTPADILTMFDSREPVVTNLFKGPVTGTQLLAVGVPVWRGDQVAQALNVGLSPDRIAQALDRHALRDGWIVVVVDGDGTVIARTREAHRYVGTPAAAALRERLLQPGRDGAIDLVTLEGIPVVGAFCRSRQSRWAVAIGAPSESLQGAALRSAAWILAAIAASALLVLRLPRRGG